MALARGTVSTDKNNPGGNNFREFTATASAGDDRLIVLAILTRNNVTIATDGVTCNGSATGVTQKLYLESGNNKFAFYEILNPSAGNNTIRIQKTGSSGFENFVCSVAQSYTGSSGIGIVGSNSTYIGNTHTRTYGSHTAGSFIFLAGVTQSDGQNPGGQNSKINGTTVNRYNELKGTSGYLATGSNNSGITAGDAVIMLRTGQNWKKITNHSVEILEGSSSTTPVITVSPSTLSGFTYVDGSGPSTAQSITYSIADATGNLVVTAPTNYEVSSSATGTYTSSFTHGGPPTGPFTTYVRLKTSLAVNTYTGNITLVSSGATQQTVALSGSVTAATTRRIIIT